MKKIIWILPLIFAVAACEPVKKGASEAVNAPTDYIGANVRAKQQAEVTTAVSTVNNAIRMFQAGEGRLPKNIGELVTEGYLPAVPSLPKGASFSYNPQTGQLGVDGY